MIKNIINGVCFSFFLIFIMIGVSGCMRSGKAEYSIDDCIKYMNEKYNENFSYNRPFNDFQPTASSLKIFLRSETHPDDDVLVAAYITNDQILYSDNYLSVIYKEETTKMFESVFSGIYGDCRIIYEIDNSAVLPDSFSKNTSFSEFVSNPRSLLSVKVLLPCGYKSDDGDEKLEKAYKMFCEKKVICTFGVYYTSNDECYNGIKTDSEIALSSDWYIHRGQICMNNDYSILSKIWG